MNRDQQINFLSVVVWGGVSKFWFGVILSCLLKFLAADKLVVLDAFYLFLYILFGAAILVMFVNELLYPENDYLIFNPLIWVEEIRDIYSGKFSRFINGT